METKKMTFIDIFRSEFFVTDPADGKEKQIQIKKILIPMIQRDYAQGRDDEDIANKVRKPFLNALYLALTSRPITLDFIYGDLSADGELIPLDGQQRLTTLFLLHWYAVKKDGVDASEYQFLKNFSYQTRYSARCFCEQLVDFTPRFVGKLSSEIFDQHWFPFDWKNDATIEAMRTMLDAIQEKFSNVSNLWERLKGGAISFYFLPIDRMGLTDDLYIKMNSRGKPLTRFEQFKAYLERNLYEFLSKERVIEIMQQIDGAWTDLLWQYSSKDHLIDDKFLRYFRFVCDIICYRNGKAPRGNKIDEFELIREYFNRSNVQASENVEMLEKFFNCWTVASLGCTPNEFGKQICSNHYEKGKVKYFTYDFLEFCLTYYGQYPFSTNARTVFLYAVIIYLLNKKHISHDQFIRRLRIVNNLIKNSGDEMSDSESRQGGNRIPAILQQVDAIIIHGVLLDTDKKEIGINFNYNQVCEEREKLDWTNKHPSLAEALFELEDHDILDGQIGIVGLEHPEYFERFLNLFKCNRDLIDCALLTCGDYSRKVGRYYQLGSSSYNNSIWRILFHRSQATRYNDTKRVLGELLSKTYIFTDTILKEKIDAYLTECEANSIYNWRYYYIKYAAFRPGRYGKYEWRNICKPYELTVLWTPKFKSDNAYQPFLKELGVGKLSVENYGELLLLDGERTVMCYQDKYVILENGQETEVVIAQNENFIDTEDRILKMRRIIQQIIA